jgi:hypothetical protein
MLAIVMTAMAKSVTVRVKVDLSNPSEEEPEIKAMYLLTQTVL